MSGKKSLLVAGSIALAFVMFVSGCGPSADLSLQFTPNASDAYQVTTEVTKDFRFEQPTAGKLREEQTTTVTTVSYTQMITAVDDSGIATADITVDTVKVRMTNKNEERLSYDSANDADQKNPLSALIGKHYTVQIAPDGKVVGFDAGQIQAAVTGGVEKRLAERMFSEEGIRERHEVPALQGFDAAKATVNQSWSETVTSPPGPLTQKNFDKVYTFTGIETRNGDKVAVIDMKALESAEAADANNSTSSMGIFAKMFDSQDDYSGKLLLDLDTGKVLESNEAFICTYVATEMPANAPADKGPDTLMMRFTHRVSMQKL